MGQNGLIAVCVTAYGDVLIGLLPMLHLDKVERNNSIGDVDVQLLVSRDGRRWRRVAGRAVFMRQGPVVAKAKRRWDMRVYPGSTMVVRDDRVYIYYIGTNDRHAEGKYTKPRPVFDRAIGLATLPAGRFVALVPSSPGAKGILRTKFFRASGRSLLVNAQLTDPKCLKVELLDEYGRVVPGFGADRSRLVRADKLRYRVVWGARGPTRAWADAPVGRPLALRFSLQRGSSYAFQIVGRRTTAGSEAKE